MEPGKVSDLTLPEGSDKVDDDDDEVSGDLNADYSKASDFTDLRPRRQRRTANKVKDLIDPDGLFFRCVPCDTLCTKVTLRDHWSCAEVKEGTKSGKFCHLQCQVCSKQFRSRGYILVHYRRHVGHMKPSCRSATCSICGKAFGGPRVLLAHMENVHAPRDKPCEYCGKTFSSDRALLAHRLNKHVGEMHTCELCGFSTRYKQSFQKHVNFVHLKQGEICATCGKEVGNLADHMRTHSEERTACDLCGKMVKPRYMAKHKSLHTEQIWSCERCGRTFSSKYSLKEHEMRHGEKKFPCPQCGKKFFTGYLLRKHIAVHEKNGQIRNRKSMWVDD